MKWTPFVLFVSVAFEGLVLCQTDSVTTAKQKAIEPQNTQAEQPATALTDENYTPMRAKSAEAHKPKYNPCVNRPGEFQNPEAGYESCHQDLGHTTPPGNGVAWCTNGPAIFTSTQVDVCENEIAKMNARITGDKLSTHGDAVIYAGLNVDWDDGTSSNLPLTANTNQNIEHKWAQSTTYRPSLLYYIQHKYHGNGSASYECRLDAQTKVFVHLKNSPECRTGVFKGTPTKTKPMPDAPNQPKQ
jgi:hypothetical protein